MDIHRWLDDTADREPPDEQQHTVPEHILPNAGHADERPAPTRYRRKRKRASSDSSLINYSPHGRSKKMRNRRSTEHVRDTAPYGARHRSRDRSRSDSSPRSREKEHKSYERRPRHKTKADRYEPKKRHDHEHSTREKPASKRRNSHRSADGGRSAGVVQSFQLKSGPKNNRLTLKPGTTAGLFRHGRASAQVPSAGAGLPDLVFNEMRFLRKPKDDRHRAASKPDKEAVTKKDRQQRREEEISAYFTADGVANQQDRPDRNDSRDSPREERDHRPRRRDPTRPPHVELPEKPFLGFGSKGQHAATQDPTNSYYTWSESEAPPETRTMPVHTQNRDTEPQAMRRSTDPVKARMAPNRVPRKSITKTLSPSVPQTIPSEPPIHVSLSADEKSLPRESEVFHTSDILRIDRGATRDFAKENVEPTTSTPTSKLLRKAFEAVHRPVGEEPMIQVQPQKKRQKSVSMIHPVLTSAIPERRLESASVLRPTRSRILSSSAARRSRQFQVFDEMLDEPRRKQDAVTPARIYANARQAEALAYSPTVHQPIPEVDQDEEQIPETVGDYSDVAPLSMLSRPNSDSYTWLPEDLGPTSGLYDVDENANKSRDEDFVGFWRPNRLY